MPVFSRILMVISVILAGIMHGHFRWSGNPDNNSDSFVRYIEKLVKCEEKDNMPDKPVDESAAAPAEEEKKESEASRESEEEGEVAGSSEWGERAGEDAEDETPLYKPLLDDADVYIAEATGKLYRAYREVEKRPEYVKEIFKLTDEALNILDALLISYPDNEDILERMGQTYKIRQEALKLGSSDK